MELMPGAICSQPNLLIGVGQKGYEDIRKIGSSARQHSGKCTLLVMVVRVGSP